MRIKLRRLNEDQRFFLLTLFTGLAAGAVAILLHKSVHFLTHLIATNLAHALWPYLLGLILVFAGGLLTTRFMTVCAGSGIPRIKILLAVHHGVIQTKEWVIKFLATFLTLSSGVPLGHEAPTIFIAGGVGSSLARRFKLKEKNVKDLIYVGCSAGIAAAFNTPIAAVVFTLEEIIGTMSTRSMGPILISSLIASVTASTFIGKNSIFTPLQYSFSDSKELLFYLGVGIVAGFAGPLFIKNAIAVKDLTQRFFKHHRLTPILIAFSFASALALINPEVMGSGLETINNLLLGHVPGFQDLLILLTLKFLACAFCYGSGMSGGIMLPIMFLGAGLGGLFGHLSAFLLGTSNIQIGAYCLVGMGAFFASVIRAPLTSIILVFEMTRDYRIVLPLMVANLVAYFIAEKLQHGSIYESMANFEGYELPSSEEDDTLSHLTVEQAYVPGVKFLKERPSYQEIIYPDQTLSFALTKLRQNKSVDHLKVVDRLNPSSMLGTLQLQHILDNIAKHHHST